MKDISLNIKALLVAFFNIVLLSCVAFPAPAWADLIDSGWKNPGRGAGNTDIAIIIAVVITIIAIALFVAISLIIAFKKHQNISSASANATNNNSSIIKPSNQVSYGAAITESEKSDGTS